jgi:hypothetical protein
LEKHTFNSVSASIPNKRTPSPRKTGFVIVWFAISAVIFKNYWKQKMKASLVFGIFQLYYIAAFQVESQTSKYEISLQPPDVVKITIETDISGRYEEERRNTCNLFLFLILAGLVSSSGTICL